eukprot:TRINITY_DN4131_c0_g2_i3.p1 TRINITY_DN4131_c0_g2~~TRINITY_DN4131_c0_g2_i3.p1  ORF type:complete len:278 (+),score=56.43 TRINITY_DN4131_c0_g2_i3:157-990(+)
MNINYMKPCHNDNSKKGKEQQIAIEQPVSSQKLIGRQVLPYTFDPKSVLENLTSNRKHDTAELQPKEQRTSPKHGLKSPEKTPLTEQPRLSLESGGDKHEPAKAEIKLKGREEAAQPKDWVDPKLIEELLNIKDVEEIKKDFAVDQQEVEEISKQIVMRSEKLKSFTKELESSDPNMLFFKNRLIRKIADIQSDLKEANSNLLILMKERVSVKEQLLLLNINNSKLKTFIKGFIEEAKAYFNDYTVDAKLDISRLSAAMTKCKVNWQFLRERTRSLE